MLNLFAFDCGWLQSKKSFFIAADSDEIVRSPVPAFLIEHPKGLALFDTGLHPRYVRTAENALPADQQGYDLKDEWDIGQRLRSIGVDPARVDWIINSHLHADHCGGNGAFPNATIVIQRKELDFARAHIDGMLYADADFETGQSFLAVDGEHDLWGDRSLILFPTYGHTPGHQSARVRLAAGDVVLTSDCCYLARNLDELVISPGNFDREMSLDVLRRLRSMRERGTRMLFGHDPDQWQGVSQGTVLR